MKLPFKRSAVAVALAAGLLAPCTGSAAGLTVTPSATSNTYSGFITLNITGLTNHEPVSVQTYLDLNNNGVVDPGDPLIDAFTVAESGVTTIGGITNINVPFDSNAATDTITSTLSFAPPIENVVGQKIYRAVSPSGRFPPVSALFNVTNAALNQAASGTVFAGGVPVPGAVVVALSQADFNYVGATMSDNTGKYLLKLPPGSYAMLPTLPGYYTDQSQAALVTLTNGMTSTNNLFLTNGVVTISGLFYDAANSNGQGGVFVQFEANSLFGIGFTDTNGNYTAGVSPNLWKVNLDSSRIARRGYLRPQGSAALADTTAGSVTNVNVAMLKGNAMFYGRLADGLGAPLANISIGANETGNQLEAEGFTDANGDYSVVALVDTNNFPGSGVWRISPNSDNVALANYVVSSSLETTLTNGEAYQQNFRVLPVTARISGRLQDNLGAPVSGVSVSAYANFGGTNYNTAQVHTDESGNYSVGAANGDWSMQVNCCGDDGLENHGLYDPVHHPVTIPPTNQVVNITVYPIGTPYLSQPTRLFGTQFGFFLSGAAGSNYTIQASTNLASTNWFTVMVISNLPGNYYFVQDSQATNRQRFYRALLGP